jgi:3-hydroxybutyryl-CoA dehydrogenase
MQINTIGVVGAGQMGNGIAQVAALSGFAVIMSDIAEELAQRGRSSIAKRLAKSVEKEKLTAEDQGAALARIRTTIKLEDMAAAEVVIEAATETQALKFQLFRDLDAICRSGAILATNTSSIPIGRIAAQTKRPEAVIGIHFMNPAPVMELVELIRALTTSNETFETARELCLKLGKTPVEASDYPGFLINRILMPMINEAVYCLYQGVGTRENIDMVMFLGANHPMGPLTLADLIGLDTCLAIMETLFHGFGDSKYRPCPLLRRYVEAGWLGRKTGRGFYNYREG